MAPGDSDVCSHVRVVVRVRPPNEREKQANSTNVVQVVDRHILVFDPKVEVVSFFHGKSVANRDVTKKKNKDVKFVYDCVFDEHSTQQEIFEQTTRVMLDGVLNGYNSTVLAYGATGAGKTHTMLGSPGQPGVMYLTMMELYNRMEMVKEEKLCNVAVSYLEVYNEQIHDLLSKSAPLAVREDAQKGVIVQGLTLHQPKSAEEILQLLEYGNHNRTQHPTDVNATSSRSHAVFQIYLRQQDKCASIDQNVRIAKMSLIDLAGSERASATNAKGARLREGTNINRSLLALGNVINALADPKAKKQHIPYRNSKLTRLLKDSLGGNCRTIMIAAVSPSSMSYDDTYNTLKYADRAKHIKSAVKSNVVSLDSHISQYVKICEQQKKEIALLKEKLKSYEEQTVSDQSCPRASHPAQQQQQQQQQEEIKRFRENLRCVFADRERIRMEYCKLEMRLKENELKMIYQRQHHEKIQMLCTAEQMQKATSKLEHRLEALTVKQNLLQKRRAEEMKCFGENTSWLHRLENEMKMLCPEKQIPQELSGDLRTCHLQLEVKDLKAQIGHMNHLVLIQEREQRHSERLLCALLPAFRRQYEALSQAGLTNAVVESDFREVEHLVQREKAVMWADQTMAEDPGRAEEQDISAIVSFSHLQYSQTTPCRSQLKKAKENVPPPVADAVLPCRKTRRKLLESPHGQAGASQPAKCNVLEDSISEELTPIIYTPEGLNRTVTLAKDTAAECGATGFMAHDPQTQSAGFTFLMTTEPSDMDTTVVLSHRSTELNPAAVSEKETQPPAGMLQRLGIPSLASRNVGKIGEKPSYMAMTSAAERKRKLLSLAAGSAIKDDNVLLPVPKRVRQDVPIDCKALRVKRTAGLARSKDHGAQRRMTRTISDSGLAVVKKQPFSMLGSARSFLQVPKKK